MSTVFHSPKNDVDGIVVMASRAPGAAITVSSGAPFGSTFPIIVTALRGDPPAPLCILEVTNIVGNVLTVSGAIEGTTDVALEVGDLVKMLITRLAIVECQDAIHALEALTATTVFTTGAQTIAGVKTFSSPIAGTITGSITEGQVTNLTTDLGLKAPLASPALTGTPTAPTASPGTNTTQLATTAYVMTGIAALINGAPGALDTLEELADALGDDANLAATVTTSLALKAPLASPTFTGVPAAPTASPGTNTTQLSTTAFVAAGLALKANLASPTFTGTPAAPTATVGTNTTQLATTAFVIANAGTSAVFVASGAGHAVGSVPDPGSTTGHTRYLREDATFKNPVGSNGVSPNYLSADVTTTSSTVADIDLGFQVIGAANDAWIVEWNLLCTGSTDGMKFTVDVPGGFDMYATYHGNAGATTAFDFERVTSAGSPTKSWCSGSITGMLRITAFIFFGSSGTAKLQIASTTNTQTNKVLTGSYMHAHLLG